MILKMGPSDSSHGERERTYEDEVGIYKQMGILLRIGKGVKQKT